MQLPLQITFRHMEPSEFVENNIRERCDKLEQYHDRIMSCQVTVEAPDKHKHKGGVYHISMDIKIVGGEIVINNKQNDNHAHEDVYVAIRDAFNAAQRRLEEKHRKTKQQVKNHEVPPHGRVLEVIPSLDYGRIETPEGREIYFHRNSVVNGDFDSLDEGDEVRFNEEMGDEGPQASSVIPVGKHHIVG
ncbi:MAG: HPF/RaiA family ribosome-associated protein [Gammaproteobacteria bacterium]|nr:HPF/RaiA family ribosome-associated protein [Gammaproteobacteria bacterium]